jgi:hypothetical protein
VKELTERYNLTDANAYPAHLPALGPLAQWLQKTMAAREAAVAYYLEAKKETLEAIHD